MVSVAVDVCEVHLCRSTRPNSKFTKHHSQNKYYNVQLALFDFMVVSRKKSLNMYTASSELGKFNTNAIGKICLDLVWNILSLSFK